MTGLLNAQTLRSPQGLKGEIFLIFSQQDREIGEKIHESLMREGLTISERPEGIKGTALQAAIQQGIEQAGTILYLASTDTQASEYCQQELGIALANNKRIIPILVQDSARQAPSTAAILPGVDFSGYSNERQYRRSLETLLKTISQETKLEPAKKTAIPSAKPLATVPAKGDRRQLVIWRSLFAAATIGLIAAIAVGGNLYQRNQEVRRNVGIVTEQRDDAIATQNKALAERKKMNDELYVAKVKADRALNQRKAMNDRLYVANVTKERAIAAKDKAISDKEEAIAERKAMNDRLYVANVRAEQAKAEVEKAEADLKASEEKVKATEEDVKRLNDLIDTITSSAVNSPSQNPGVLP